MTRSESGRPVSVVTGYLVRRMGDTVVLTFGLRRPDTLRLGSTRRLEVRTGYAGSRATEGAVLGFLVGAAGGAVIGASAHQPCEPRTDGLFGGCMDLMGSGPVVIGGALVGGLVGAVVGAAIGGSSRREVWAPVTEPTVRLSLRIGSSGAGMGLRAEF